MRTSIATLCLTVVCGLTACKSWDPNEKTIVDRTTTTIDDFKKQDPDINDFFKKAYGYAVFPAIGKGAFIAGGGGGNGLVYEKRRVVGSVTTAEFTIGLQAGAQKYSQIIFFKDAPALEKLKTGSLQFGANVSAVALKAGAAKGSSFSDGVAVFILPRGGLMAEASIGSQTFAYTPIKK